MVYVNGHNLGRHWNIGPQQRLYCPAMVKEGNNEIIVFDLLQNRKISYCERRQNALLMLFSFGIVIISAFASKKY